MADRKLLKTVLFRVPVGAVPVLRHSVAAALSRRMHVLPANETKAFTLIEVLVAIAIIAILVSLALLGLQASRSQARRLACANQLKQIALAVHAYESAVYSLPALRSGYVDKETQLPSHSVRSLILPYVEQQSVFDRLNYDLHSAHPDNQAAIITVVDVYVCPARRRVLPQSRETLGPWVFQGLRRDGIDDPEVLAAVCDYKPNAGVSNLECTPEQKAAGAPSQGFGVWNRRPAGISSLTDVPDGQSNTILWGEQAGRPDQYSRTSARSSKIHVLPYNSWGGQFRVGMEAGWATGKGSAFVSGAGDNPSEKYHVNIHNSYTLFSFHSSGANAAMCDGAVHFIAVETARKVVESLLVVDDGGPQDF